MHCTVFGCYSCGHLNSQSQYTRCKFVLPVSLSWFWLVLNTLKMRQTSPTTTLQAKPAGGGKPDAATVFGYTPPPEIQLGRDVYKFLQRLDLSIPVKHPRRDLSNGFVVAEILSRFFPADIQMHSYQNGTSERCKRDNWDQIQRVCQKNDLQLPAKIVDGTVQGQPGAAVSLLELLYEKFTGKKVQRVDPKDLPGMDAVAAAAAALPTLSFGAPAAASESGSLKAVKATHGAAVSLEFGAVQTQQAVGDAAALRRKFAAADSPAGGTAS